MAETIRIGFPKGHTSFALYSESFKLSGYTHYVIDESNISTRLIRITFIRDVSKYSGPRDVLRKLYTTNPGKNLGKNYSFSSVHAPTRRFLGIERSTESRFEGTVVPLHVITETDNATLVDIDLTGDVIRGLIKAATRKADKVTKQAKAPKSTITPPVKSKAVALERVRAIADGLPRLSLPGNLTLQDLSRMQGKIVFVDSDENPHLVTVKA